MTRIKYESSSFLKRLGSLSQPSEKAKRQIYIIMASSLILFLVSTFALVAMLPSPVDHVGSMIGADPVVRTRATNNVNDRENMREKTRFKNPQELRHHYERMVHHKHDLKPGPESKPPRNAAEIHGEGRTDQKITDPKYTSRPNDSRAVMGREKPRGIAVKNHRHRQNPTMKKTIRANSQTGYNHGEERKINHRNAIDQKPKPVAQQSIGNDSTLIESDDYNEPEEDRPRLIHILETRFMQNQPNLVELAKARLRLFSTICLPTVLHQTAWGKFLWVIRADPELHDDIKEELVSMLNEYGVLVKKDDDGKEHALTYVIGSNDNYVVSNSTTLSPSVRPFDTLGMLSNALAEPQSIFAGKASSMQMFFDEISSQKFEKDIFLWTRLDADDGLNIGYMEYIQSQVIRYFLPDRYDMEIMTEIPEGRLKTKKETLDEAKNKTLATSDGVEEKQKMIKNNFTPPQWTYWCAALNIDWFLTDPTHDPDHKNGTVYPVIHANVCVTPGVTVALRGSFDPLQVPRLDHDKIISYLRPKGGKLCGRTGLSIFGPDEMGEEQHKDDDDGSCFHMVSIGIASVRSRTPTSAGMLGVTPDATQLELAKKKPTIIAFMWNSMMKHYHISNKNLLATNAYFAEHIYDIAEENAKGQCTKGHSCKSSSKDLLQQYVDLKSEIGGGIDIIQVTADTYKQIAANTTEELEENEPRLIHILETRFMQNQPSLVHLAKARLRLLETICLPTVLHQTNWGQFLWVIRTDPDLDDEIKQELVRILNETGALVKKDKNGEERALTYVIGSNENYIVSNSTNLSSSARPFDILGMLSNALSKPQSILAGKAESMQMLFEEISSQKVVKDVFIWTRLDADDGLNVAYMEFIQNEAIRYFLPHLYEKEILTEIPEGRLLSNQQGVIEKGTGEEANNKTLVTSDSGEETQKLIKNPFTPPQWTYWCAQLNIDWFLTDPTHDPDHKNGTVYPVMHKNACVTPGVTVALRGSFDPLQVPRLDHDKIISYLRPKGGKLCGRTGLSIFGPEDIGYNEEGEKDDGSCFHMATGGIAAVRSRTPTSAGMLGVHPDANQMGSVSLKPKLTPFMWQSLRKKFHVSNKNLLATNAYFDEHIYDIAEENAKGQCTSGHSCKSSSKDLLQQYVDLKGEMGGGFDIAD